MPDGLRTLQHVYKYGGRLSRACGVNMQGGGPRVGDRGYYSPIEGTSKQGRYVYGHRIA